MVADIEKVMDIAKLAEDSGYGLQLQRLKYIQENNEYMTSFMGQFSAGKSCLINNLIGKKVLPVHITETTALITLIRYDINERTEVYYKDGHIETIDITESEKLWQGNESTALKDIESLTIYVDADILKTGLVIADTPGINTVIKEHKALAADILESSDKIVYVLGKATSEEDIRFIAKIKAYGLSVLLVRTHMDQIKQAEEDVNETIFSEECYLQPYTDDKIFFLSNEPNSEFFKEIEKLKEYIGKTLGSNIQKTIDDTIKERLLFIAERLKRLLYEKVELLSNDSKEFQVQQEKLQAKQKEVADIIEKLKSILNTNKERIEKQYSSDKKIADENLQVIVNNAEARIREVLDKNDYGEDIEKYTQVVHNFLNDIYETMYKTYISVFDRMLGENKATLCQELNKSCPQFELEEYIPDDIDSLSEQQNRIREQILELQVQKNIYKQEIEQLEADKSQNLERKALLETNIKQINDRYDNIRQELEQYPDYEARYVVVQEASHEHEDLLRTVGNMLDWITVFIPGGGWVKAGSQVMSAGSKAVTKIPKTKKIVTGLNKAAKTLESSKKITKIANNIDHVIDITKVVKKKGWELTERATDVGMPEKERKGISAILDLLSFEYHLGNFGKKLDRQEIIDIDYEYERQYKQGKEEIIKRMRQSAKEEIKRREELLDLDDKTEKAEMEEKVRRMKQQQADEEIARLEIELNMDKQQKKDKLIKEHYINQALSSIDEMKKHIQKEIADNINKQLGEYIATVNIGVKTKIKDKELEIDNITNMYNNSSEEELKDKLKELEDSIAYLDNLITAEAR